MSDSEPGDALIRGASAGSDAGGSCDVDGSGPGLMADGTFRLGTSAGVPIDSPAAGGVLGLSECSEVMERCARFPIPRSAPYLCGPNVGAAEVLALLESP